MENNESFTVFWMVTGELVQRHIADQEITSFQTGDKESSCYLYQIVLEQLLYVIQRLETDSVFCVTAT